MDGVGHFLLDGTRVIAMRTLTGSLLGLMFAISSGCGSSSDNNDKGSAGTGGEAGKGGSSGAGGSTGGSGGSTGGSGGTTGGSGGMTGGASGTGGSGGSIALTDLPARYVEATCATFERCAGPDLLDFILGGADCVTQLTARVQDGDFNRIEAAVQNGTVLYDATAAPDCIGTIENAPCNELVGLSVDACEQALAGTVDLGGNCELDQECIGENTYCRIDAACPGTCVTRLGAGSACQGDNECQSGLQCFQGTCVAPPTMAGQICGGGVAPDCPLGMICIGDNADTAQTGTCGDPSTVFSQMPGAPCSLDNDQLCVYGAYCAITGVTQSGLSTVCEVPATSGGMCNFAFPDMCPAGEYCSVTIADITGGVYQGTCTPLPGDGEPCVTTFGKTCEPGAACDNNVCRTLQRLGSSCVDDGACYSGNCASGMCAIPDPCAQ